MKKSISFISLLLCLPLLVCGLFFITNLNSNSSVSAEGSTIYLANASGNGNVAFTEFIDNYETNTNYHNANVVLTEDIDLQGNFFTNTIGSVTHPFTGTFDGRGYSISNFTYEDQSETLANNSYVGIFGYTDGATIKNLQVSGTFAVTLHNSADVSLGILLGYGINTKIDMCLVNATFRTLNVQTIDNEPTYFKNLNFGGIAGSLQGNSSITYTISRPASLPNINLNSLYSDIVKIGGIVGNLDSSSIVFSVSQTSITVNIDENYLGNVYVGGIVGYVSQYSSKIINCVTETSLNVSSNIATVGRIGGVISYPSPLNYNISNIYYYTDGTSFFDTFGNKGDYALTNAEANLVSETSTIQRFSGGIQAYFSTKSWNVLVGEDWDFVNIWRTAEQNINLQAFIDSFVLTVDDSINNVFEIVTTFEDSYRYDDVASFTFQFISSEDNQVTANFYRLSSLTLGNTTVGNFKYDEDTGNYSLSNVSGYDRISMTGPEVVEGLVQYTIIISGITSNYRGNYSVNISPVEFRGEFTYRLYDEDDHGDLVLIEEESPTECYVYYTNGDQDARYITINDLTYGYTATISTRPNTTSLYAFRGWYLVGAGEDGEDLCISEDTENPSRTLTMVFGQGYFVDDFEVYARYVSDSCDITFVIDEGVNQVILGSDQYIIDTTDTQISIFKQLTELRMQLYLEPNYNFDAETFMENLNTYNLDDVTIDFCTMIGDGPTTLEDGRVLYEFNLNLANLNTTDYGDRFSITFSTEHDDSGDNTFIWIIVGSVAGGLLLIGLIILIVVLVKRRGIGGGGGKIKSSFKKGMYY